MEMKSTLFLLLCTVIAGVECRRKRQSSQGTCADIYSNCGDYISYCNRIESGWKDWMTQNCAKTCGLCSPCKDEYSNCKDYRKYCQQEGGGWKDFMTKYCIKTCGMCNVFPPTPSPPTTASPTTSPSNMACGSKGKSFTRIVGGDIADPGDWPWQVTYDWVQNTANPGHWCGASIISPYWILSAAHCFGYSKRPEEYKLTVGDFDIGSHEGHEQRIKIEKIIVHKKYNSLPLDYDIAMVKLSTPIKYTARVRPVCLPDDGMDFAVGTNCYVTGWGKTAEIGGKFPKRLYQAKVPLIDRQECTRSYAENHNSVITERMRCAGFASGGIDACQGDSGGPLVCKRGNQWYLMGAVSWGVGCARPGAYGVYADIVNLKSWVVQTMQS